VWVGVGVGVCVRGGSGGPSLGGGEEGNPGEGGLEVEEGGVGEVDEEERGAHGQGCVCVYVCVYVCICERGLKMGRRGII
jgi:hypothetical protein